MAERVGDLMTSRVDRLPPRLRRWLPRELVGFAILGAFTFLVDLALLASLRTWTRLPLPVAVTMAFACRGGIRRLGRLQPSAMASTPAALRSFLPVCARSELVGRVIWWRRRQWDHAQLATRSGRVVVRCARRRLTSLTLIGMRALPGSDDPVPAASPALAFCIWLLLLHT